MCYRVITRVRLDHIDQAVRAYQQFNYLACDPKTPIQVSLIPADHTVWLPTPVVEIGTHNGYLVLAVAKTATLEDAALIYRALMEGMFEYGYSDCLDGDCFEDSSPLPWRGENDGGQTITIEDLAFGFGFGLQKAEVLL